MARIEIFDTTLRDGEQAPGFSMSSNGKLRVAQALADLRVDVIEAGFAAASPGDAAIVERIADQVVGPTICSLARATPGDIKAAARALAPAPRKRIHLFIGTSPLHRDAKLKMSKAQVLDTIAHMVALAREHADDVEFSAEDAIRTERDYLVEALSTAADAGARVLNVPDTVGYATPSEITDLFCYLNAQVSRADDVIFSAHCHNDLGLAVANSLAAVEGGARQIECALNGIGERAGNCSLEEVVMALKTRQDYFAADLAVETQHLMQASRTLAQATNTHVPRNKAVVGVNAFAHEAGIHQHGVLANRATYEIMRAEDVGQQAGMLVLGKHSGKHALKARAEQLGYDLSDAMLAEAFAGFKNLADDIGIVDDARLCTLLDGLIAGTPTNLWTLGHLDLHSSLAASNRPVAQVSLDHQTRGRVTEVASGSGELDAAFAAITLIMDVNASVDSLDLQYIARDQQTTLDPQAAKVLVQIEVQVDGSRYHGRAVGRDVIPACVEAFIDALNNAIALRQRMGQSVPKADGALRIDGGAPQEISHGNPRS